MSSDNDSITKIIDGHVYLGDSINGYSLGQQDLLSSMEALDIDGAVVCTVQPRGYHLGPENDKIANIVTQNRDKLIGFCRVDPRLENEAMDELKRAAELGLRGLLLHPWEEGYRINSEQAIKVAALAAEMDMPVLVETGYPWVSHALQVADLCYRVPRARVMMSHGGQINISGLAQADAFAALRRHPNLFIQTSGVYRQDFLEEVVNELGAHRVMFGSTAPVMAQSFEIKRISNLNITEREKQQIFSENLLQLFN